MIEEQLAAKYNKELMYSIQKHVLSHNVFSLDEVHNLAFEAEDVGPKAICPSFDDNKTYKVMF